MFSLPQAVRCAEAQVQLISPFVGRIYDWYKSGEQTRLLRRGRSGRAIGAGDLHLLQEVRLQDRSDGRELPQHRARSANWPAATLTISPELMKELAESNEPLERKLDPAKAKAASSERLELDEKKFRWLFNDNAMATEKTSRRDPQVRRRHREAGEIHRGQDRIGKRVQRIQGSGFRKS